MGTKDTINAERVRKLHAKKGTPSYLKKNVTQNADSTEKVHP